MKLFTIWRNKIGALPIRRKFLLITILISLFALSLSSTVILYYNTTTLKSLFVKRWLSLASALSKRYELAISNETALKTIFMPLPDIEEVLYAAFYATNGTLIAEYKNDKASSTYIPSFNTISAFINNNKQYKMENRSLLLVRQAKDRDNNTLAYLLLEINADHIRRVLRTSIIVLLTVTFIVIAITSMIAFKLRGYLTNPITNLISIADKVAKNKDYSLRVPTISTSDEIASLINSFNHMLNVVEYHTKEIKQINETLEERVHQRTKELEKENEEREKRENELKKQTLLLEEKNRELQDFAYVVSHDLQEPLRKILAFSDRLQSRLGNSIPDEAKEYLLRMQNAASRMSKLIEGLLSYSRVATKQYNFEPVHLRSMVEDAVMNLEHLFTSTGARLVCEELPIIEADPLQMRQLFQNLIGNALKYHKPNVPPFIHIKAQRIVNPSELPEVEPTEFAEITIEDNGIGFENQYADKIFGVFYRLHGQQDYQGTGIGLAICKKIVERHNGKIFAEGTPDIGAKFTIILPIKQKRDKRT